ncbi:DUF4351 domain-containing protein [Thermosynechococcaceae cyanobacterium BACA0444]|uniref:DUF4351 domain-containing protein n=1 Tax=Pseudocalidococcus azoricus BACA0444 TaxID=2918990 RepID=A0AAE4FS47_9CYAN|nr:DUF4351 domain-containing protein [Pseudocalidococcus azoricus BACA0444]
MSSITTAPDYNQWLDGIETILVSRFPKAGLEGVGKMLGIQIDPAIAAQVRSLTTERLEALSEALLGLKDISEFQAWLSNPD